MEIVSQERTGMIVGNILIGVQCTIFAVAGFSGGYGCGATPVLIKLTREFGDERWQPSWAASDMQVAAGMVFPASVSEGFNMGCGFVVWWFYAVEVLRC
ncbi:hypothetical protein Ancab_019986 [Ancistrocladus abbreviatus]